ncbi:MAG: tyrosine-type recombinase/integrase [Thermodesulfovibrionales bacterium]
MGTETKNDSKRYEWVEKGIYMRGNRYYIAYSRNGKQYREPVRKAKTITAVRRALQSRQGEVVDGRFMGLRHYTTTLTELAVDMLTDPKKRNLKDYRGLVSRTKNILRYFLSMSVLEISQMEDYLNLHKNDLAGFMKQWKGSNRKATSISTDDINAYIESRLEAGKENGTINRELSALQCMFTLAYESRPRKIPEPLKISSLPEDHIREGFVEPEEYEAFKDLLPFHVKGVYMLAYFSGMRKGEITRIEHNQVTWNERKITLRRIQTKNNEPRVFFVYDDALWSYMLNHKQIRDTRFPNCKYLFFTPDGKQIGEFRKSFDSAIIKFKGSLQFRCRDCENTFALTVNTAERASKKIPCSHCGSTSIVRDDRLFHDLRRTGVRNLIHQGVPQKTAMLISGHKTDAVFRRYLIIDESDIKAACKKIASNHTPANLSHFYHTNTNSPLFQLSETTANV